MQGGIYRWIACGLAVGLLALGAQAVCADELAFPGSDPAYTQAPSGQLVSTSSLASLESRLAALESAMVEQAEGPCQWEDVSKEKFSVKMGGRIYGDMGFWAHQNDESLAAYGDEQNFFEFRTFRFFAQGEGYGVFDYKLELDFAVSGITMKDVYMGIHDVPMLGYIRFGFFKDPFSLDELTSSKYVPFMERSLPTDAFALKRLVGMCAYNNSADEQFAWAYGAFFQDVNDTVHEKVADEQGIRLTCRGVWSPWYEADGRGVLHLGAGCSWTDVADDEIRFSVRPAIHEASKWVDTGTRHVDQYSMANVEAALVYGPLSLQSEMFVVDANGVDGEQDQEYYGAYAYATYFLTGEHRPYKRTSGTFGRVKPNTNFWIVNTCDGCCTGWGAWELAARWSWVQLQNDGVQGAPGATPGVYLDGHLHDITLGVNWYWNPYMRVMFNYMHPIASLDGLDDPATGDILAMRFQVDW